MTPRVIAIHLPQFHPVPENDAWWGKGFTEWTNVTRARSLFPGHYQPHLPADLGFYDLRLPEARAAQAELARAYGIGGFCYYHYWFNGRRILEKPVEAILQSGTPDFPFCICWANENWTRAWDGQEREILLKQDYSREDDLAHIRSLLPMLADGRYLRVGGKPMVLIYSVRKLPDPKATTDLWRDEAVKAGLPGLHLTAVESFGDTIDGPSLGFDSSLEFQPRGGDLHNAGVRRRQWWRRAWAKTQEQAFLDHYFFDYDTLADNASARPFPAYPYIRSVTPGWDNTARKKKGAVVLLNSTPQRYQAWLEATLRQTQKEQRVVGEGEPPLVFVNAWNEWAEGNHLEPDQKWGRAYLDATKAAIDAVGGPAAR
jgi:lipopolysaccharide biosynthesis protein